MDARSLKVAALGQFLRSQAVLAAHAGALAGGAISSSALGFAYWWFAARYFSPDAVGQTAAAVSIMSLIGLFGQFGLGTLLIGQNQIDRKSVAVLISTSLAVSLTVSALIGAGFVLLSARFPIGLGAITGAWGGAVCFVIGCAFTGCALVLDNAFIGLLRSSLQTYRNLVFSLLKLVLLAAVAGAVWIAGRAGDAAPAGLEQWIFGGWALGAALATAAFVGYLARVLPGGLPRPNLSALRTRTRAVLSHHLLDIATQAPAIAMPFLVAVLLSPAVNAAFNAAWLILRITFFVPTSLTTVLFAVGVAEPDAFAARLRFSLLACVAAGLAVELVFLVFGPFILSMFNPAYPDLAGASFEVMGLAFIAVSINCHYLSIQRLRHRMLAASVLFAMGGVLELSLAFLGSQISGLLGLTVGWTVAVFIQALLVLPTVLGAAGLGRLSAAKLHRRTAS